MSNIIWVQPDQTLAVTSIFDGSDPREHAALLQERGDVPAEFEAIAFDVEWPSDEWAHESHRWGGKKIVVDFDAAKDETKTRIRVERVSFFEKNDIKLRDAIAENNEQEKLIAIAERDRLRSITDIADLASTLEDLKNIIL